MRTIGSPSVSQSTGLKARPLMYRAISPSLTHSHPSGNSSRSIAVLQQCLHLSDELHDARLVLGHALQNLLRRLVLDRLRLDQSQSGECEVIVLVLDNLRGHAPGAARL